MFLHILPQSYFSYQYILNIKENFTSGHEFIILNLGELKIKFEEINNIYLVNKINYDSIRNIREKMKKAKGIILHSFFIPKAMYFLLLNNKILKKTNWTIWGGDIYDLNDKNNFTTIKSKMKLKLKRYITKRIAFITTIVKGDYDVAKKNYNVQGVHLCEKNILLDYNFINFLKDIKNKKQENNDVINIQIGNSATKTNNHVNIFKLLEKFKYEKIKIYVPLSYGDMSYAEEVIKAGEEIFGDKFIPLKRYIEKDEYYELLNTIHIGIFGNNRQQALGNIYTQLFLGCKVYIYFNTSMSEKIKRNEFDIFDIEKIKSYGFDQFIKFSKESNRNNEKNYFKYINSQKLFTQAWGDVFTAMS